MPITRMRTAANPYAPLAWKTSVAVLALEKLRKAKTIRNDELEALRAVADQLDLFCKASEISLGDNNPDAGRSPYEPRLRTSFFTLRAIKGERASSPIKPLQFKRAGEELHAIRQAYLESNNPEDLDPALLDNAQGTCLELLEHLNKQRPNPTAR